LCWCWQIFVVLGHKLFVWRAFSWKKKTACYLLLTINHGSEKLTPLNMIIATAREIAVPWKFLCVWGLPYCWCWQIFVVLERKVFVWRAFSWIKNNEVSIYLYNLQDKGKRWLGGRGREGMVDEFFLHTAYLGIYMYAV